MHYWPTRRLVCFGDIDAVPAKHQNAQWAAIAAGSSHAVGVLQSGQTVCWGFVWKSDATAVPAVTSTTARWVAVAAGDQFSCGVLRDSDALGVSRQLICWGFNGLSQAESLSKYDSVASVAAGSQHSCWGRCWGRNAFLQAASLSKLDSAVSVAAGWEHSCYILSANGELVCRGTNVNGQMDVPRLP